MDSQPFSVLYAVGSSDCPPHSVMKSCCSIFRGESWLSGGLGVCWHLGGELQSLACVLHLDGTSHQLRLPVPVPGHMSEQETVLGRVLGRRELAGEVPWGQPGDLRVHELRMAFVGCACTWTQCPGQSGPVICPPDFPLLLMSPELMMDFLVVSCTELSNLSLLLYPKLCSQDEGWGSLWGHLALGGERLGLAWFGESGFHVGWVHG